MFDKKKIDDALVVDIYDRILTFEHVYANARQDCRDVIELYHNAYALVSKIKHNIEAYYSPTKKRKVLNNSNKRKDNESFFKTLW